LRIGLVAYRDRGDDYITKRFDLTDDIDAVYTNLKSFVAAGGGDPPESVNQALDEAVHKLTWTKGDNVLRIIFLVGDYPPHMDYPDDVKYPVTCEDAAKAGIIIDTIQCGNQATCTPIWQDIARKSEGQYVQLSQTGSMVAMTTPYDEGIAKLSGDLSSTVVGWGDARQQREVADKAAMPLARARGGRGGAGGAGGAAPLAERAAYNLSTGGKAVQGRGDLVADVAENRVKLEEIKDTDLPDNLKPMTMDQRKEFLQGQQTNRAAINAEIEKLSRQRTEYIDAEKKKTAGKGDSFDAKVAEIVNEQAAKKLK